VRQAAASISSIVLVAALAAAPALAAKPQTQAQYDAAALKVSMVKKFKSTASLKSVVIGKVVCVLPKNGATFHCTANTSSKPAHEDLVFKVAATLHDNDATSVTWTMTSVSCSDSTTHKKLAC
jgi:hypothetical protein